MVNVHNTSIQMETYFRCFNCSYKVKRGFPNSLTAAFCPICRRGQCVSHALMADTEPAWWTEPPLKPIVLDDTAKFVRLTYGGEIQPNPEIDAAIKAGWTLDGDTLTPPATTAK